MKIPEFGTLSMVRTNEQHFGNSRIVPATKYLASDSAVTSVDKVSRDTEAVALSRTSSANQSKSFQNFLFEALDSENSNQNDVTKLQEKMITNPDDVDIHDVTIAMSKARMSLNLAQSIIDRLVTDWNEITTTR